MDLRLHDAQSAVAREHGFASWSELSGYVEACQRLAADPETSRLHWLALVYAGDVAGGTHRAQPALARRLLDERPELPGNDPWMACAIGDLAALREATHRDPGWLQRAGGPLGLPPLVAVTHSCLLRLPEFAELLRLRALAAGRGRRPAANRGQSLAAGLAAGALRDRAAVSTLWRSRPEP